MQSTKILSATRMLVLTLLANLLGFWALAQDGGGASVSVNTTKTTSTSSEGWYTAPWVWIVGAAVFILLLVALLNNRGGRSNNTAA